MYRCDRGRHTGTSEDGGMLNSIRRWDEKGVN